MRFSENGSDKYIPGLFLPCSDRFQSYIDGCSVQCPETDEEARKSYLPFPQDQIERGRNILYQTRKRKTLCFSDQSCKDGSVKTDLAGIFQIDIALSHEFLYLKHQVFSSFKKNTFRIQQIQLFFQGISI